MPLYQALSFTRPSEGPDYSRLRRTKPLRG